MNRLQARETIRTLLNDIENSDLAHNWPDAMLNAFIQEAIDEIAQRTLCNKDSISPEYCVIPMEANVIHYPFPDGVLAITDVRPSWGIRPLALTTADLMNQQQAAWTTTVTAPSKFLTDFSSGYLSLVGRLTSVTTEQLDLTVHRMPAVLGHDNDALDIPVRFHHYCYNWVMYRCLQKLGNDEDAAKKYGVEMSQRFLVAFEGNPSQQGYGGDIGKITRMLNNFTAAPRCSSYF